MAQTEVQAHDHAHAGHDHAAHAHAGGTRAGAAVRHARAATPTLSLLRLSAGERLLGAGAIAAGLWVLVAWAMS